MTGNPQAGGNVHIPKRIIHVWASLSDKPGPQRDLLLPLAARASAANARLLHPDYDYCLFDNIGIADFLRREFPQYLEPYGRFRYPIQKFDFFRYLAIYRLGGFYLDLDIYLARSLESLRRHTCVFPFEELTLSRYLRDRCGFDWEVGNYAFGAEPGHPFLLAVIENCIRSLDDPRWAMELYRNVPPFFREQFIVTNTTGPGLVTRTLAENRQLGRSVAVLFPEDVRDPRTWHRFGDYGVHMMGSSWRKADGAIRRRLARLWESRTRSHFAMASIQRGARRHGEWIACLPDSET